ncbi:glycosyl hydrolase family 28-related protein [Algicella marina]|uniref:Right-handed parallel beta-helix repeat-containing protein n=1 Tax=Algicella marina TaxID=2683284 RepID=A0A6P1T0D5_9RHOB|nr:glycosyl hydrolase family 28-related protein [Algicella marina]QHQ35467.1 right-handed parallel beta-helix repeat-containing protein [Algicella marina]
MNKAITEGLDFMPPAFIDGLGVWSSGAGTPGSPRYSNDPNGTLVASDPDFGPCIEIVKADSPQRLRYTGETPLLPGCYLEISARVKLVSGPFPTVRASGFAGDVNGNWIGGSLTGQGPAISLDEYGRIYTVRAIVGSGNRTGVDMVWGTEPVYGHFGIDIEGSNGAVVRVESIQIHDRTDVFHRKLMDWVDVRDYGAIGDGIADDAAAFETADAAANGRDLIVPAGTYYLGKNVTLLSRVRFEGTVTQAAEHRFILRASFDFPTYVDAFGDERTALTKALQTLFNFSDHESLDLKGRRIQLSAPIDVAAAAPSITTFGNRRAIRNGQLEATDSAGWDPDMVTTQGSYSDANPLELTNVSAVASIEVGSLITGFGVGRDVYVRDRNIGAQTLTLSQPLGRANSQQSYTFTRYKYLLDFGGMENVNAFNISDIEFLCNRRANGVMLPDRGIAWSIRDCWFSRPRTRAISSKGTACQGISIDRNQFIAPDDDVPVPQRNSTAFNINGDDAKIRNNRCVQFKHFAIINGGGSLVLGNHFWQLDDDIDGENTAGLVFTRTSNKSAVVGNYIDNMSIELANEHDPNGDVYGNGFGKITITGNIFTAQKVPDWFTFIKIRPRGNNWFMNGITVANNAFKVFGASIIDRIDEYDDAFGTLDHTATRDVIFTGNSFEKVRDKAESPVTVRHEQTNVNSSWTVQFDRFLPFGGELLGVDGVVAHGPVQANGGATLYDMPWAETRQGGNSNRVRLHWSAGCTGVVQVRGRCDAPGD